MEQRTKLWTKDFILLCFSSFILYTGFHMLLPIMPAYAEKLGASEVIAGLVAGVFAFSALVSRPIAGLLIDRRGRKGMLILGFALFVLAVFLYNFVYLIVMLLLLRVVHGFGFGIVTTALGTVAADVIPPVNRAEGLGYFGMNALLPMAIAAPLAVYLRNNLGFPYIFLTSTILACIAFAIAMLVNCLPVVKKEQQIKSEIFEPSSLRSSSVLFFLSIIFGGVVTFIVLYSDSLGIGNSGLFFSVYAIALVAIRPVAGRMSDRRGADIVVIPGLILATAGAIILGLAQNLAYFLASAVLIGVGFGIAQPSLLALTVKLAPAERRGAANATFFSAMDLGIGVGAIILGALSTSVGYANMYLFSSLAGLMSLILYGQLLYGEKGKGIPELAGRLNSGR